MRLNREKMRFAFAAVLLLALTICAVSCAGSKCGPVRKKGYVSLSTAATEELFLLGVGDRIVGDSIYCNYPPEARRLRRVGNLIRPNIEEIARLSPEIVFATEITPPEVLRKMESLGLRVVVLPDEKSVADIERNLLALGKIVGREERARAVWRKAKREIEKIRPGGGPRPKVFIEVGAKPLITTGRGTYLDDVVRLAGGENIAAEAHTGYTRFSREEVLRRNPDVVLMVTMGDVSRDEEREWKRFTSLRATRNNGLCFLDADTSCRPTPDAFVKTIRATVRCLNAAGGK